MMYRDWNHLKNAIKRISGSDPSPFSAWWGLCFGCAATSLTAVLPLVATDLPGWIKPMLWGGVAVGICTGSATLVFEKILRRKRKADAGELLDFINEIEKSFQLNHEKVGADDGPKP
jgi:hypothetical protein